MKKTLYTPLHLLIIGLTSVNGLTTNAIVNSLFTTCLSVGNPASGAPADLSVDCKLLNLNMTYGNQFRVGCGAAPGPNWEIDGNVIASIKLSGTNLCLDSTIPPGQYTFLMNA